MNRQARVQIDGELLGDSPKAVILREISAVLDELDLSIPKGSDALSIDLHVKGIKLEESCLP